MSAQDRNDIRPAKEREGFETLGPAARVSLDFSRKTKRAERRSEGLEKRVPFHGGTSGPNPHRSAGESILDRKYRDRGGRHQLLGVDWESIAALVIGARPTSGLAIGRPLEYVLSTTAGSAERIRSKAERITSLIDSW